MKKAANERFWGMIPSSWEFWFLNVRNRAPTTVEMVQDVRKRRASPETCHWTLWPPDRKESQYWCCQILFTICIRRSGSQLDFDLIHGFTENLMKILCIIFNIHTFLRICGIMRQLAGKIFVWNFGCCILIYWRMRQSWGHSKLGGISRKCWKLTALKGCAVHRVASLCNLLICGLFSTPSLISARISRCGPVHEHGSS